MDFRMSDVEAAVRAFDAGAPTGDPFLDGRWDWHAETFGHPEPYYRLFYRLSEALRPGLVVELGAWRCTGAAAWAPHAGRVVTVDHHSDPGDDENERWCREAAQRYANLLYLKGWTWDVADEVPDGIDVLFVDSWHHYDKAVRDWDAYRPKLASPALVICDDVHDLEPTLHDMVRFWNDASAGRERFLLEGVAPYPMGFFRWER